MPDFNKDRIFNESSQKVLIREYQRLKEDYSKLNAMKYFTLYENSPLSFILENSRYIFSEPIKGLTFYKYIIETSVLPFNSMGNEYEKVEAYYNENCDNMSNEQKELYSELINELDNLVSHNKNSISLYDNIMENPDMVFPYYDALYEYQKTQNDELLNKLSSMASENNENIMDTIHILSNVPELSSNLYTFVKSYWIEDPESPEDYKFNVFSSNVLSTMVMDEDIMKMIKSISNMNVRHLILEIAGIKDSDTLKSITEEKVINYDPIYSTPENSVNRIFEDAEYDEIYKEANVEDKVNRLLCEKAVVDMNLSFMCADNMSHLLVDENDETSRRSSIVEKLCVESTDIERIPTTFEGQIAILEKESLRLENEINSLVEEKYFSSDGGPGRIISSSNGKSADDSNMVKKNVSSDDDEDDETPIRTYTPKSKLSNIDDEDDEDDEYDEDDEPSSKKKYDKIDKPEKPNVFRRVQNKALDANVQFKKKVANGRRKSVDVRNAGKAVAKIPVNVTDSIKKQVDEWDRMDDDKRKEYIIKPGFRKKYFKALKLCIMHYGAFAVNPVLNIVLLICHKFSNTKDIRIRNELIRELKAEIKVTDEKIEDAKSNGDNQQKYKLMRIKEKLNAELVRVMANSAYM
jgi:hypothetical protein